MWRTVCLSSSQSKRLCGKTRFTNSFLYLSNVKAIKAENNLSLSLSFNWCPFFLNLTRIYLTLHRTGAAWVYRRLTQSVVTHQSQCHTPLHHRAKQQASSPLVMTTIGGLNTMTTLIIWRMDKEQTDKVHRTQSTERENCSNINNHHVRYYRKHNLGFRKVPLENVK